MLESALTLFLPLHTPFFSACAEQGIPFYRFSPQLDERIDLGETDKVKLLNMIMWAKMCMHEDAQMDKLVPLLHRVTSPH